MKKTFTFILLFHVALLCSAARISNEKAISLAREFMQSRQKANRSKGIRPSDSQLSATQLLDGSVVAVNSSANGFVLLAGDADTELILGYADQGTFSFDDAPDNVKAWIQEYADQLKAMENNPTTKQRAMQKAAPKATIEPLILTKWDQAEPYNYQCYVTNDRGYKSRYVTGCVATAMAQVINYHKWPTGEVAAIGSYSIYTGTVSELPAATMDWDNMLDVYNYGEYNDEQAAAVAQLMRYCGQSVYMTYAPGASSARSEIIPEALINTFGYSKNTRLVYRNNYTIDSWDNLLYTELAASRPILYSGASTDTGHEFVVDGYEDGYYHVNWGWSGKYDGYFLISLLNPHGNSGIGASSTSDGYTCYQNAVIGIQKENGDPDVILTIEDDPYLQNDMYMFKVRNNTKKEIGFYGAIVVETAQGKIYGTNTFLYETLGVGSSTSFGVPSNFASALRDGDYIIYPAIYNPYVSPEEQMQKCEGADLHYISCTVSDRSPKNIQLVHSATASDISISSYENTGDGLNCHPQNLKVTFSNASANEYNQPIRFFFDGKNTHTVGLTIRPGGTTTLDFSFLGYSVGQHDFFITGDGTTIGSGRITLADSGIDTSKWFAVCEFDDMEVIDGNKNVMFSDMCKAKITFYNPTKTDGTKSIKVGIGSNGTITHGLSWTITLYAGFKYSDTYYIGDIGSLDNFQCIVQGDYDGHILSLTDIIACHGGKAEDAAGNKYYVAPGGTVPANATSADFSCIGDAVSSLSATASSNPNCVYYIAKGATAPEWMAGKNVVVGNVAESLTLTAAGDFKPTKDFTAQQASFTQSFTGTNGNGYGWNTIVLPFEATSVKNGSTPLNWFTGSSNSSYDFWIYQFADKRAGNLVFNHLSDTSVPAYTPLLIAVPDATWGEASSLAGKPLTFSATNAFIKADKKAVVNQANYQMKGTFSTLSADNIYVLHPAGGIFEMGTPATTTPFTAYFNSFDPDSAFPKLGISINGDVLTGISTMRSKSFTPSATYNIMGQKIGKQPGIVIVDGKKFLKR